MSIQHCMIAPTISQKLYTDASGVTTFDAALYSSVTISADNLAGVEEVDIYEAAGNTWKIATDGTGTAYKLTATVTSWNLIGGKTYAVSKDATAGACGVYAHPVVN